MKQQNPIVLLHPRLVRIPVLVKESCEERASKIQQERDHDRGGNAHAADGQLVHSIE
jgi:hypothetical protein